MAQSQLKLEEIKRKTCDTFWNKFLTPKLTSKKSTEQSKLPTEKGLPLEPGMSQLQHLSCSTKKNWKNYKTDFITTQMQKIPHMEPQPFTTPSSVKRKFNTTENDYTFMGSMGGSPSKLFRSNLNLDQAECLFTPQLDSTQTKTEDFDGRLSLTLDD